MDFSAPNFKFQLYVYKNGRDKADKVIHFSDGYEITPSGAISFYQIYRDEEGKPKKVAVASYPAGKWENCLLMDQFDNYMALNGRAKKYSTTAGTELPSSDESYNKSYQADSELVNHTTNQEHYIENNNSDNHNNSTTNNHDDFNNDYESNNQVENSSSEHSYDGYVDLDAPSIHSTTHTNNHDDSSSDTTHSDSSQDYSYHNDNSHNSNSSSASDDYSSLENFLDDAPTSTSSTTENKNDYSNYENSHNSLLEDNQTEALQKEEVSIDSIYNAPSTPNSIANVVNDNSNINSSYTPPVSSNSSYNNGNNTYSNSKPSYNNNNKFNKGGNNGQQMSFAEMKALKENFLSSSIVSYMNMKDKIFNLDEIVVYATRVNANSIRFSPDDVVLVAYNLIKDKKTSPEKYTTKEKQKRLNMYLPPIIKRHGLEKKSMLVTYLNDKEETKDMNLLDVGAWLVYNGYV